ncbi:MAG: hypothetical protein KDA99_22130 [Planctomycetales bacterium]|nr:hypothetical protein [Planctomycetales bacterium]
MLWISGWCEEIKGELVRDSRNTNATEVAGAFARGIRMFASTPERAVNSRNLDSADHGGRRNHIQ